MFIIIKDRSHIQQYIKCVISVENLWNPKCMKFSCRNSNMNTTKNSIAFKIPKQPLDMNFRNSNKEVVLNHTSHVEFVSRYNGMTQQNSYNGL